MKFKAKIASVEDNPREWNDFFIVEGHFENGSKFSQWGKDRAKAIEIRNTLAGMTGQEGEFEIDETKDKTYKGVTEHRLKGWPGKPQPAFGGGGFGGKGREFVPRFRDTPEAFQMEQRSIHRSVALQQAIASLAAQGNTGPSPDQTKWVLDTADKFYQWLSQDAPIVAKPPQPVPESQPAPPQSAPPQHRETIGPQIGANHPSVRELRDHIGGSLTTGDQVKPAFVRYMELIESAPDLEHLDKIPKMIEDSCRNKKTISQGQADELYLLIADRRAALIPF